MWQLKLKQHSRKGRQVAAWSELKQPYFPQRNWNLTQQLYKCSSEQLRGELQLLLVICVLAGSAPVSVFSSCCRKSREAVQHIWLVLLYVWLCAAAYWELVQSSLRLTELEHRFYMFESLTYLIHVPCIMILSVRWRHRIPAVFDRITGYDLTSGYIIKKGSIRNFIRYQLLFVLCFSGCYVPIIFIYCDYEVWKSLFNLSTYVLPNILSGISLVPYYSLLQGIYQRFKYLNNILQLPQQRGLLQQLRLQHRNLLEFTKATNRNFGISILCVYISSFINFNTNLFLVYKSIEKPDAAEWAWWIYMILWLCMHLGKMFIILYFNHSVQQQQARCLALMCKMRVESDHLIDSINRFVLQLQLNVRAHLACGLINLDYKLITALLMATANVFIFLLQYDITYQALSRSLNETKI